MLRTTLTAMFVFFLFQQSSPEKLILQLDQIAKEYMAVKSREGIGRDEKIGMLVSLDSKLRQLLDEPWKQGYKSYDGKYWKASWQPIGIYVSHYGDDLGYSGKLLVEAHSMDNFTEYRKFTLFSAILGEGTYHGLGEMPNPMIAVQYLEEFSDGPFADETAIILGNFYTDSTL